MEYNHSPLPPQTCHNSLAPLLLKIHKIHAETGTVSTIPVFRFLLSALCALCGFLFNNYQLFFKIKSLSSEYLGNSGFIALAFSRY